MSLINERGYLGDLTMTTKCLVYGAGAHYQKFTDKDNYKLMYACIVVYQELIIPYYFIGPIQCLIV